MQNQKISHQNNHLRLKTFRYLALATSIAFFVLIVLGGIARVTQSGGACPDWPTCFGQFTPPVGENAMLDYLHRLTTVVAVGMLISTLVVGRRWLSTQTGIRNALAAALSILAAQIMLGALISQGWFSGGESWSTALHLALSLMILGCVLMVTVKAFYLSQMPAKPLGFNFGSSFGRHSLLTLGLVFTLLVSGIVLSGSDLAGACAGWPLCNGSVIPQDPAVWLSLVHRLIVLVAGSVLVALLVRAWRSQRTQTAVIVATTSAAVLFFAQALLGAKMVQGFPAYLLGLHEATAVAAWAALVIQVSAVGLAGRSTADEVAEAAQIKGRKGVWRDMLMLTKPIVVVLLLVTTYAGMVIGAHAFPPLSLAFWTLLAGFMAAGGSGAINQYIDREDDIRMQRTQKRPIPSGRLSPGEGLAFGVGMALASFFLMVSFVNLLAALLSLAGIIYYVLLYSIFLKKTTVQNIVIGGGAGAIPPLVGWAAATGSLNIPSLFLFAIVFMWTPPHFWALALVRRNDYARAGVPMLPVVRGETETRWQIFLYTVELVGLTLLLPLFGLGGSVYLIGAGLLGLWLLMAAWKVWKQGGNKLAWKMYRYSSMYLAFLFVVLMVDALI
jgi:protoheme IX farnesyltransferase